MKKKPLLVFIDTNIWLLPYLQKIDIFTELERLLTHEKKYEIVTSLGVVNELKEIMRRKSAKRKEKTAAKIALELIERTKVTILDEYQGGGNNEVDKFILKLAREHKNGFILCTNDKELRRKLKKVEGTKKIICMREKNRLEFL
jgi:rRNA-processing protein FCF1